MKLRNYETIIGNNYLVIEKETKQLFAIVNRQQLPDEEEDVNVFQGREVTKITPHTGVEWYVDLIDNDGYSIHWDIYETEAMTMEELRNLRPEYFL